MSTIAADPRDLRGVLIDLDDVGLVGIGLAVGGGERGVQRLERRDRRIDHRSEEKAIASIARAVVAGRDHAGRGRSNADVRAGCDVAVASFVGPGME